MAGAPPSFIVLRIGVIERRLLIEERVLGGRRTHRTLIFQGVPCGFGQSDPPFDGKLPQELLDELVVDVIVPACVFAGVGGINRPDHLDEVREGCTEG